MVYSYLHVKNDSGRTYAIYSHGRMDHSKIIGNNITAEGPDILAIYFRTGSTDIELSNNVININATDQAGRALYFRHDEQTEILRNIISLTGEGARGITFETSGSDVKIKENKIIIKNFDATKQIRKNVMFVYRNHNFIETSTNNYVILESATPDGQDVNTDDIQNLVCNISNNAIVTGEVEFLVTENSGNSNEIKRYLCPRSN